MATRAELESNKNGFPLNSAMHTGEEVAYTKMLDYIKSLPEEPIENDLEKEFNHFLDEIEGVPRMYHPEEQIEWGKDIAQHFANWQRKKMLKNIVLETVVMKDDDGDGIETPYEEWLTLENTEIPSLPENIDLKDGDKVKVIIIKEENT
mgnify:CR=1 FL=1